MALGNFSVFYYSIKVDSTNRYLNFYEGGGELTAAIDSGTYSLTDILTAIKTAMDGVGGQEYTVTLDRIQRKITISADSNFDLLVATGTQAGTSIFSDIGFSSYDRTGSNSYTSNGQASSEYIPQFWIQDYVESDNYREKISPTVNESADGVIEVVSFGERKFFEMSFKFITDIEMDGKIIRNNPNGIADFRNFMNNIIQKGPIEFMPDVNNRDFFYKILLESTDSSQYGVGYKLKELTNKNLPNVFELNNVKFREL